MSKILRRSHLNILNNLPDFVRQVYKIIAEFDETECKNYFRQQNQLIKQSSVVLLDDDEFNAP